MSGVALTVGATPVKSVYVGSTPVTAVYVGSTLVWQAVKEVVQITMGTGTQARDQFRAALAERGLGHATITEIPFEIELVGTGSAREMFQGCAALTTVPAMDTSNVTNMYGMFWNCSALTHVSAMDTSGVTDIRYTFYNCPSLTDGNVRLIGRHPNVRTTGMIDGSGLTREPFYDTNGNPI